jgi:hypothetical protein
MTVLFDTQAYHRTLTEAGIPAGQADAHMRALELALEGGVATKQDIRSVEHKLDGAVRDFEQKLELAVRDLKIWTGGIGFALLGAGLAIAKLIWT